MQTEFENETRTFLFDVRDYILQSFEDLNKKIISEFKFGEMDCRLPAVAMVSFIRKRIIAGYPYYCRNATQSRFKLTTPTGEYIYVKKLDENKFPSNIETTNNDKIIHQVTDSSTEKGCNVFVGYIAESDFSKIIGIYASCIKGDKLIWATDLNNLDNNNLIINFDPQSGSPKLKDGVVRIKKAE